MSLINDALKRAQTAQRPILPAPKAKFQPVLDAPSPKYGLPVLLLAGVATFPLVAFLAVRLVLHRPSLDIQANASPAPVTANVQPTTTTTTPPPAPEPQSAPTVAVELPAPTAATSPAIPPGPPLS